MGDTVTIRRNLSDVVAEDIKDKIMTGEYKSGEQIPNEFNIAKDYDVSRFTVREAIKKVSALGILEIVRGKGTYVSKVVPSSLMKPLLSMLTLKDINIMEVSDARYAIESRTTYLCTNNSSDDELKDLEEILKKMEKELIKKDLKNYSKLDFEFHLKIAQYSKNSILYEIFKTLQVLLQTWIKMSNEKPEDYDKSYHYHKLILEKMQMRDAEEAAKLMEEHIVGGINYFKSLAIKL